MNATTALELANRKKPRNLVHRAHVSLMGIAELVSQTMAVVRIDHKETVVRDVTRYRIGDVVQHVQFGSGQVLAIWPDGRLQIRFETEGRNQLIFPSLVNTIS
jgi:hypothetical protein